MAASTTCPVDRNVHVGGKFLTFGLADEVYGLPILKVREIIGLMDITPVPGTPPFIKGVINLRGKVIPVTDLRAKFAVPVGEATASTCIVVVYVGELEMGLVVDRVCEVTDLPAGRIEDVPSFGCAVDVEFLCGIGKVNERIVLLLDIEKVLSVREKQRLSDMQRA